MLGGLLSVRKY